MAEASAYFLTWNGWPWPDMAKEAASTSRGLHVDRDWATGNTRKIVAGDRVFLVKQGGEPKGIIGSGRAIGSVVDGPHYDAARAAEGKRANYVKVRFDRILDLRDQYPLPLHSSSDPVLAGTPWDAPASGFSLTTEEYTAVKAAWEAHLVSAEALRFQRGSAYSREDIQQRLGLKPSSGGNWHTGYHRHEEDWYLFPTIGGASRTGHDYENRWEGTRLRWSGKTGAKVGQPSVDAMIAADARVHLFGRENDREKFTYYGLVRAVEVVPTVPVRVLWEPADEVVESVGASIAFPEEAGGFWEGERRMVYVSAAERNPLAREACIRHWGTTCAVCGLSLEDRYGPVAAGYTHVHHLSPLSNTDAERLVDPVKDLRPVCPNCHAVLHMRTPPLSIGEVRDLLPKARAASVLDEPLRDA